MPNSVTNILSVDVEEYFCANNLRDALPRDQWDRQHLTVVESTGRLLELFARRGVSATFFVLGWVAERAPDLVRRIEAGGHEVATHGYSHRLLTEMTPEEFDADLARALAVTQPLIAQKIEGFRAPSFTIVNKTAWALDILAKHGLRYDASMFPIGFHPDYGVGKGPTTIHRLKQGLVEVPVSCVDILGMRVPATGGFYFRALPYCVSRSLYRRCNALGQPVVFYLHPWEVDPQQPRVKLPATKAFRHYYNLDRTLARLDRLLGHFRFAAIRDVLPGMQL